MITCWASIRTTERRWGDSHLQDDTPMWSSGLTPASQAGKAGSIPVIGTTLAEAVRCDNPPVEHTHRSQPLRDTSPTRGKYLSSCGDGGMCTSILINSKGGDLHKEVAKAPLRFGLCPGRLNQNLSVLSPRLPDTAVWCNGNTRGFDPCFTGSNPAAASRAKALAISDPL